MQRILSRPNSPKLVITFVVVGALVLAYEATTFDLLPWGASAVVNPSAPVPGARLDFSATAYCKGKTTASGLEARTGIAAADDSILPVGSVVNVATGRRQEKMCSPRNPIDLSGPIMVRCRPGQGRLDRPWGETVPMLRPLRTEATP